ncbi:ketopantoate reductase family protein [Thalassobaculum litoreum]|uniref:2-dehydropantoate 2-reductase n=1 Tax=Thalassobaculum litoreum DSM 18839 TaxID=1123362 RepID=A0A8G2BJN3_9PROT|nr:2-dehydropantoate 2-reductase [Thalassobaculum litoreum]SDG08756.1 2-dehydropantoate 2-reductase [Thalassobaculum litoreum DSM 18839]
MRIGIIGAGAVGGFMAGHLARAGTDVAVLARGPHLAAMREKGIRVETRGETWTSRVTASDRAADLGTVDVIVVTAKGPALPAIAEAIQPMLGADTPVVCAMNGIPWWYEYKRDGGSGGPIERLDPGATIWNGIGPQRAIGCMIDCPATVVEPGSVRHVGPRPGIFTLGEPDNSESARVTAIAKVIEDADMGAPVTTAIRRAIWAKLLINASRSPLGVLTGSTERGLAENPETLAVTLAIMREAQAVAASHGIEVSIDEAGQSDPSKRSLHRSSMLQDWDLGRPMEIDGIVRIIQDYGRAAGIATPVLDTVSAMLGEKARAAGI